MLQLLDAVSRMASLGFEKSYRETVVLMTRSYLNKLSSIGSAESKTVAPEATTERVEVCILTFTCTIHILIRCLICRLIRWMLTGSITFQTLPAGFLLIAGGLKNTKLRSDYRHRLLSLCSDVGLAAESQCGR